MKTIISGLILSSITWLGYHYIGKRIENADETNLTTDTTQSNSSAVVKPLVPATNYSEHKPERIPPREHTETISAPVQPPVENRQGSRLATGKLASSKALLSGLNDIFVKWSFLEWTLDTYIDESLSISEITESEISNAYIIKGEFTANRKFKGLFSVGFSCKATVNGRVITITRLCYSDNTINDEKCCTPGRWSLDKINQ